MTIYHDHIMDHYKNPRNSGCKSCKSNHSSHMHNPSCGDKIVLKIKATNGLIEDICFEGYGCALSTAAASMLTESVKGKSVEYAISLTANDVVGLLAIPVSQVRMRCATLPLEALHESLKSIETRIKNA